MYIGAEIQIVSVVDSLMDIMPDAIPAEEILPSQVGVASIASLGTADITGLVDYGNLADSDLRIILPQIKLNEFDSDTIQALDYIFDDLGQLITTNSPTWDEDDDLTDSATPRFDQSFDTFDKVNYTAYDSDGS